MSVWLKQCSMSTSLYYSDPYASINDVNINASGWIVCQCGDLIRPEYFNVIQVHKFSLSYYNTVHALFHSIPFHHYLFQSSDTQGLSEDNLSIIVQATQSSTEVSLQIKCMILTLLNIFLLDFFISVWTGVLQIKTFF